ncbi:2-phospho-L-lactate guanylyltransferase [Microbacterium fluvii]|uniref:2-phospho-L-lactate guanylyltransferase n=1 Tax=Microbacterium fluvii TaxID=415215 RepID=A0ABW2HD61_9MICO|nr:2-phospho-L-lactate guanylyltransferase [Microbacterium fluvii]MCU4672914.1 2-phospho-L-lactate guanylyltransferase [Microbacterium fluvii]
MSWIVVVPVKPAAAGKSRLEAPGVDRVALARAIALDTIAAAAACAEVGQVVVVTDDGMLALGAAGIPGLRFEPETPASAAPPTGDSAPSPVAPPEPGSSRPHDAALAVLAAGGSRLDAAVAIGAAVADGRPTAALLGDLPALRPEDLAQALEAAASVDRAVVADAEGTGSTLVTAGAGVPWASSFGDGSLARHVALGCAPLDVPADSTLRRDVDTADQLEAARALGLGPRTSALLD